MLKLFEQNSKKYCTTQNIFCILLLFIDSTFNFRINLQSTLLINSNF